MSGSTRITDCSLLLFNLNVSMCVNEPATTHAEFAQRVNY